MDTLYLSLFLMVQRNHACLSGYIDEYRKKLGKEAYFAEFKKLATAWGTQKKRLSDGGPLPP